MVWPAVERCVCSAFRSYEALRLRATAFFSVHVPTLECVSQILPSAILARAVFSESSDALASETNLSISSSPIALHPLPAAKSCWLLRARGKIRWLHGPLLLGPAPITGRSSRRHARTAPCRNIMTFTTKIDKEKRNVVIKICEKV